MSDIEPVSIEQTCFVDFIWIHSQQHKAKKLHAYLVIRRLLTRSQARGAPQVGDPSLPFPSSEEWQGVSTRETPCKTGCTMTTTNTTIRMKYKGEDAVVNASQRHHVVPLRSILFFYVVNIQCWVWSRRYKRAQKEATTIVPYTKSMFVYILKTLSLCISLTQGS